LLKYSKHINFFPNCEIFKKLTPFEDLNRRRLTVSLLGQKVSKTITNYLPHYSGSSICWTTDSIQWTGRGFRL